MRTITFDLDTGDMLGADAHNAGEVTGTSFAMTGAVAARIASYVLPGMTPEDVDAAYSAHLDRDEPVPDVATLRAVVLTPSGHHGTVIGTKSTDGVLHSVQVRLDAAGSPAEWYSPTELIPAREGGETDA